MTGNAYDDASAPRVPATLRDALALWEGSDDRPPKRSATRWSPTTPTTPGSSWPRSTPPVTDWELVRGFERL